MLNSMFLCHIVCSIDNNFTINMKYYQTIFFTFVLSIFQIYLLNSFKIHNSLVQFSPKSKNKKQKQLQILWYCFKIIINLIQNVWYSFKNIMDLKLVSLNKMAICSKWWKCSIKAMDVFFVNRIIINAI